MKIRKLLKSFYHALQGWGHLFREQPNAWVHLTISVCVVLAGFFFQLTNAEWLWIIIAIGSVFSAELMNSAIEETVNFISPGFDKKAGKIKDLAAGAVFVTAIAAAIIGVIIFVPKFISYW